MIKIAALLFKGQGYSLFLKMRSLIFLAGHKIAKQSNGCDTGNIIPAKRGCCFPVMRSRMLVVRWICSVDSGPAIGAVAYSLQVLAPLPGLYERICINNPERRCFFITVLCLYGKSGGYSQTGDKQIFFK